MAKLTVKPSKIKVRQVWSFNPVTRTVPSKKLYKRSKQVWV